MKNIMFLLLVIVLWGCDTQEYEYPSYDHTIECTVSGTASSVTIEYYYQGAFIKDTNVALPWSKIIRSWTDMNEYTYYNISIHVYSEDAADTYIMVRCIADGEIKTEGIAEGPYCEVEL